MIKKEEMNKAIFFGSLLEATGVSEFEVHDAVDIYSLKSKVLAEFPRLRDYKFLLALHHQVVNGNMELIDGDVVAFLPPFAGG